MEFALASRTGGVPRVLDRRISNSGRIADIRQRDPQQIFTTGGISKFSMLGSQNAISYVPIAFKVDAETQTDKEKQKKPILPGATRKETAETGTGEGLYGTTQSEASKTAMGVRKVIEDIEQRKAEEQKARESIKEPEDKPPFELNTDVGEKGFEAYQEYLVTRYGADAGKMRAEEIKMDSTSFTKTMVVYRNISKQITAFNKDDLGRFLQFARNMVVKFGEAVVDALIDAGAKRIGLAPGDGDGEEKEKDKKTDKEEAEDKKKAEKNKNIVDITKKIVKSFLPSGTEDFVKTMKELQDNLFVGKPEWKQKLKKIQFDDFMKWDADVRRELGIDNLPEMLRGGAKKKEEPAPEPAKRRKVRVKKEEPAPEPAPEPPKKRKVRKSVKMEI